MRCMRRYIFFFFLFLLHTGARLSQAQPNRPTFRLYTEEDGLCHRSVTCVTQDHEGFIWIGTADGLNRFDGTHFSHFKPHPDDTLSLSSGNILTLFEDSHHRLWAGTSAGLNLFDRNTLTFKRFLPEEGNPNSLKNQYVRAVFEDSKGRLWVGTWDGLCLFNETDHSFRYVPFPWPENRTIWNYNCIHVIKEDCEGKLWIGTMGGGLVVYNPAKGTFERYRHNPNDPNSPGNNEIRDIYIDKKDNVWVATWGGHLNLRRKGSRTFEKIKLPGSDKTGSLLQVTALCPTEGNSLWIGSEEGLFLYNTDKESFTHYNHNDNNPLSLKSKIVYRIFKDRQGGMWVHSTSDGLNYFHPDYPLFDYYFAIRGDSNTLKNNFIAGLTELDSAHILVRTHYGAQIFNPYTKTFTDTKLITQDNRPITQKNTEATLTVFDKRSQRNLLISLLDTSIYASTNYTTHGAYRLTENEYFILTRGGLVYYNLKSKHTVLIRPVSQYKWSINSIDTRSYLLIPPSRFLMYNTDNMQELVFLDTAWFRNPAHAGRNADTAAYRFVPIPIDGKIQYASCDEFNRVWVGTDRGLLRLNPDTKKTSRIYPFNKNTETEIELAIAENENILWLLTNQGLLRADIAAKTTRVFSKSDGLYSDRLNGKIALKTSAGLIVLGGNNGITVFDPKSIVPDSSTAPLVLEAVLLFNMPISPHKNQSDKQLPHITCDIRLLNHLVLKHNQNYLTFRFSALDYIAPEKIQYAYLLEGFDKQWNYCGNERSAYYMNLPPGRYRFHVKSTNSAGIWCSNELTFRLTIRQPWWKSSVARIIYIALILMLLAILRRVTLMRLHLRNQLEIEHMRHEKQQEIMRLEKEAEQMKTRFFMNISHELRTPLSLILGPVATLTGMNDLNKRARAMVMLIQRNASRLLLLVNQMLDLRKLDMNAMTLNSDEQDFVAFVQRIAENFDNWAKTKNINFLCNLPSPPLPFCFDADKMEKILVNLLSNAFKYTPRDGTIRVKAEIIPPQTNPLLSSNTLALCVSDNGPGIERSKQESIFKRFYQIDYQGHNQNQGTGIGLALTKELVELMQGQISVDSEPGKGTTFTLMFPFKTEPTNKSSNETDPDPINPLPANEFPLLLIVDDNPDMLLYLREHLNEQYRILEAPNGIAAFELAKENIPDLIISDVMMPGMDGFELCRLIKEELITSHIPVMLLTAFASREKQLEGLKKGADDYLTKPPDISQLLLKVKNLLATRKNLMNYISNERPEADAAETPADNPEHEFLLKIKTVVLQHLTDSDFTADHLGRELALSRRQLYRKVSALTNTTVNDLINEVRLSEARNFLISNDMSLIEIAMNVGFTDPKHFGRLFKERFGVTPKQFAIQHKQS